jgi:hypothetical protein
LLRSRALLASVHGDEDRCRELVAQYRTVAAAAGFDALVASASVLAPATMSLRPARRSGTTLTEP